MATINLKEVSNLVVVYQSFTFQAAVVVKTSNPSSVRILPPTDGVVVWVSPWSHRPKRVHWKTTEIFSSVSQSITAFSFTHFCFAMRIDLLIKSLTFKLWWTTLTSWPARKTSKFAMRITSMKGDPICVIGNSMNNSLMIFLGIWLKSFNLYKNKYHRFTPKIEISSVK